MIKVTLGKRFGWNIFNYPIRLYFINEKVIAKQMRDRLNFLMLFLLRKARNFNNFR